MTFKPLYSILDRNIGKEEEKEEEEEEGFHFGSQFCSFYLSQIVLKKKKKRIRQALNRKTIGHFKD